MSGGSHEYLCHKAPDELFQYTHVLEQMRDDLIESGALDAAKETESILLILNQFEVRVGERMDRLKPVWKAVEWWKSYDSGFGSVESALAEYRGEDALT